MRATLVTRFQVPDTVLLTVVTLCCAASVYNLLICVRETLYSVNTPPLLLPPAPGNRHATLPFCDQDSFGSLVSLEPGSNCS